MADDPGPTQVWGNGGGGTTNRKIDGSHTGPTFPAYMDPYQHHGELTIFRLTGIDKEGNKVALPIKPFVIQQSIKHIAGIIERAFLEKGGTAYALKVRKAEQIRLLTSGDERTDRWIAGFRYPAQISQHGKMRGELS